MASTTLSDVYEPSVVEPYIRERTAAKSALFQSGVIQQLPVFDEMARQKGKRIDLPFFQDLGTGNLTDGFNSQAHTDTDDITVNSISGTNQEAVKNRRVNSWGAADLVDTVTGENVVESIVDRVGSYWAREVQLTVLMSLNGIFKASGPLGSGATNPHVLDVHTSGEDLAGSEGKGYPILEAANLLGDNWSSVTAIAMHSAKLLDLQKADIIEYVKLSDQLPEIPTFMGKAVIEDDMLPKDTTDTTATKYTTYLFGSGAFAYGEGAPKVPSEVDRNALTNGGQEILVSRKHFVVHPNGLSYTDTIAGDTPTQAELETAADWSLQYEHKNVPIVAIQSQ